MRKPARRTKPCKVESRLSCQTVIPRTAPHCFELTIEGRALSPSDLLPLTSQPHPNRLCIICGIPILGLTPFSAHSGRGLGFYPEARGPATGVAHRPLPRESKPPRNSTPCGRCSPPTPPRDGPSSPRKGTPERAPLAFHSLCRMPDTPGTCSDASNCVTPIHIQPDGVDFRWQQARISWRQKTG